MTDPNWTTTSMDENRRSQLRAWSALTLEERFTAFGRLMGRAHTIDDARRAGRLRHIRGADMLAETREPYRTSSTTHVFQGCRPTPMSAYLKGLGIFRLVAEQADPNARACWRDGQLALDTILDSDGLADFFLQRYQPTPILAPWNGGSGFFPKDHASAKKGFNPIRSGNAPRFHHLRHAIRQVSRILEAMGIREKPAGSAKQALLRRIHAECDDRMLLWLDAAVVLTEGDPKYPPLLGTGGNDGRLDFTNNFLQRLVDLFDPETGAPKPHSADLLNESLYRTPTPELARQAVGQFDPGGVGGPNATTGFESDSLVNPWEFVLMLEGALLFAAAATRRFEHAGEATRLAYPFTVRPTGSGSGSASLSDESPARAEIWLPLWQRPLGLAELRLVLGEGRADLARRVARDGLDFVRAVTRLGVERGITGFQRYGFMMRSGKAYLATPLNNVRVRLNPDTDLIDQLESNRFLDRFRRYARSGPARGVRLIHTLEDALFDLAQESGSRTQRTQRVLMVLGDIVLYLGRNPSAREPLACPVLPRLDMNWLTAADDGRMPIHVAAGLAGIGKTMDWPMLTHVVPINPKYPERFVETSRDLCWGGGSLVRSLARVLHRRLADCERHTKASHENGPSSHVPKPLTGVPPVPLAQVLSFLDDAQGHHDSDIERLMCGLSLIRYLPKRLPSHAPRPVPDLTYDLLKPFFTPNDLMIERKRIDRALPIPKHMVRLLTANRIGDALELALRQLRIAGLATPVRSPHTVRRDGSRLLAALMVPLESRDLHALFTRIEPPENQHAHDKETDQ